MLSFANKRAFYNCRFKLKGNRQEVFFFLKHQKNQKVNTSKIAFGACENNNYSLKYLSRRLLKTNSHRLELAG